MDIPAYKGKPLSVISRLKIPHVQHPLWLWSNVKNLRLETPEIANQLASTGYQPVPETDDIQWQVIASSQFTDATTFLINPEKGSVKLWMRTSDIE
ncbi:MAG TPA: hypothetical protein VGN34_12775, partial [Ktedonobacteraceae bacterium]